MNDLAIRPPGWVGWGNITSFRRLPLPSGGFLVARVIRHWATRQVINA